MGKSFSKRVEKQKSYSNVIIKFIKGIDMEECAGYNDN